MSNEINTIKNQNENKRVIYLDIVRILACFLVVLVHVSAQHIFDNPANTSEFITHASYNCLAFSGVSLYIMISGALMLNSKKEITVNAAIRKTLHMYFLYFAWKLIYDIFNLILKRDSVDLKVIKDIFIDVISGRGYYHLWFLPTIAIIYLFLPMIKKSLENDKIVCQYYLILFFILNIIVETVYNFKFKYKYILVDFLSYNNFYLFTGYIGYFILGHYLNKFCNEIKKPVRIVLYITSICLIPIAGIINSYISVRDSELKVPMNNPFSVFSFIITVSIFIFIKNLKFDEKLANKEKVIKVISLLSLMTLGIYLIHPMIIMLVENLGLNSLLFIPALSIPLIMIIDTVITGIIVFILIKIPIINKLIK